MSGLPTSYLASPIGIESSVLRKVWPETSSQAPSLEEGFGEGFFFLSLSFFPLFFAGFLSLPSLCKKTETRKKKLTWGSRGSARRLSASGNGSDSSLYFEQLGGMEEERTGELLERLREKERKRESKKERKKTRLAPERYVASVRVALCVSSPTSLSLLPSRSGLSSGDRRQAGRPRRRLSASKEAPFGDLDLRSRWKKE